MVDRRPVAISLRDVTKTFSETAQPAVSSLTLDIAEGQIIALVGPSGCGKTTTLRMINRLIEPTSGTIEVLGENQRSIPAHELRRRIGYVIQHIGLFPHQKIRRNIGAVPELLGWDRSMIDERCRELVDLVGLEPDLLDRYPAELSGGQQQRVGVARALAADPPILLMDEPYSAVDPIVRERLQDELLGLQSRLHKTIVIVTHDVDEAIRLADQVAVLNIGGIIEQYDTPEAILRNPSSEFVASFLGRERGLRRLALLTVDQLATVQGPAVGIEATVSQARHLADAHGVNWFAIIDGTRLIGWLPGDSATALTRPDDDTIADLLADGIQLNQFVAVVSPTTPVREALDTLVTSASQMAAVLDNGIYRGMITIQQVADALR